LATVAIITADKDVAVFAPMLKIVSEGSFGTITRNNGRGQKIIVLSKVALLPIVRIRLKEQKIIYF